MRILYTILAIILLPIAFLRLYIKSRNNADYRKRFRERLGYPPFKLDNCIWLHCVSLGETIAATPIIKNLLKTYPNDNILITTTTPTGSDQVIKSFGNRVKHCYMPYDLPRLIKRFLLKTKPKLIIIMETELWPNLLHICHKNKIPSILANARLSEKSYKKYAQFPKITKEMLNSLTCIAAQAAPDGNRFLKLGFAAKKLAIMGNIKFDITLPDDIDKKAKPISSMFKNRPVWIAASTHEGEEEIILRAHKIIKQTVKDALLILVPRHPERFDSVYNLCNKYGFNTTRRSSATKCTAKTDILLGDSMGEMMLYYASSNIAFVGGSLNNTGGHNLLEPAALAKPVLSGPTLHNFTQISKLLLDNNALIIVKNANGLADNIIKLFESPDLQIALGKAGAKIVDQNRGALDKICKIVDGKLNHVS